MSRKRIRRSYILIFLTVFALRMYSLSRDFCSFMTFRSSLLLSHTHTQMLEIRVDRLEKEERRKDRERFCTCYCVCTYVCEISQRCQTCFSGTDELLEARAQASDTRRIKNKSVRQSDKRCEHV